jgi:molybdopterin-binding protein
VSARLSLRDVVVRRGRQTVLAAPALDVRAGEVLAVLGPNGAGKSTLLQTLALLERPAMGEVRYDGAPVRGREPAYRRRMAVVFQEPLLLDGSVRDNVALGLRLRGIGRAERRRRVAVWLERLGIAHLAGRRTHTLSGGEAQRAALARAFVLEPEVLLLDEPFAGLDAPTRVRLRADLARLLRETRLTTVVVTHERDEALQLADRVAVVIGGRLRQVDETALVFSRPCDPEVAAFVGVETVVRGRVVRVDAGLADIRVGDAMVAAVVAHPPRPDAETAPAPGEVVYVCIRPEDVVLAPAAPAASPSSARNRLTGRVAAVLPAAGGCRVEVDCGFPLVALVTRRSVEELGIVPGEALTASFKATAVHLIGGRGEVERAAGPK